MKITLEIKPSRVTKFLGAQASKVQTGAKTARVKVHSVYSRVAGGAKNQLRKVPRPYLQSPITFTK